MVTIEPRLDRREGGVEPVRGHHATLQHLADIHSTLPFVIEFVLGAPLVPNTGGVAAWISRE